MDYSALSILTDRNTLVLSMDYSALSILTDRNTLVLSMDYSALSILSMVSSEPDPIKINALACHIEVKNWVVT